MRSLHQISILLLSALLLFPGILHPGGADLCAQPLEHDAKAIVLSEDISYEVAGNDATLDVVRKIKVNNADGKDFGYVLLTESKFKQLKKFHGSVCDSEGNRIFSCDKNDVEAIRGYSKYSLYVDVCHRLFSLVSDRYPFTIEYEYQFKHHSLFFWPDWEPQKEVPVIMSQYRLKLPSDLGFTTRAEGDISEPVVSADGTDRIYIWELDSLPGVKAEDYAPADAELGARLRFSPNIFELGNCDFDSESWLTLGRGYNCLSHSCFELSDEQRTMCNAISTQYPSDTAKCEALHDSLRSRLRYVAVEIGVGGWKPSVAKESFKLGYGDCKDLSVIYVAMLREMGIEANVALIRTRSSGTTYPDFPIISSFNHVILLANLDGDTVWSDPTCQYCEFGDLPWHDESAYTLSVTANGGFLLLTPSPPPSDNVVTRRAEMSISGKKAISGAIDVTLKGDAYHIARLFLEDFSRKQLERLVRSDLIGISDSYHIDSVQCIDPGTSSDVVRIKTFGNSRNAVFATGKRKYVDLSFMAPMRKREKVSLSGRNEPIELLFPIDYEDSISLDVPNGWEMSEQRGKSEVQNEFGSVRVNLSRKNGRVQLARSRLSTAHMIDRDQFEQYSACRDSINRECKGVLVFDVP